MRQVLDQEHRKYLLKKAAEVSQARFAKGGIEGEDETEHSGIVSLRGGKSDKMSGSDGKGLTARGKGNDLKRDFFGRVIQQKEEPNEGMHDKGKGGVKVWVSYKEGFSNAVKKPISLADLMRGF